MEKLKLIFSKFAETAKSNIDKEPMLIIPYVSIFALIAAILVLLILLLKWLFPLIVVGVCLWFDKGAPPLKSRQNTNNSREISDRFAEQMCEILGILYDRAGVVKPYDPNSTWLNPTQCGNVTIYHCKAAQSEKSRTDDETLEEYRLIINERACDLQSPLFVDKITVSGKRFIYDILDMNDPKSRKYANQKASVNVTPTIGEISLDDKEF